MGGEIIVVFFGLVLAAVVYAMMNAAVYKQAVRHGQEASDGDA